MSNNDEHLPGRGLLGWLGRQVGHVKRALSSDVGSKRLYRNETIEEEPHPQQPNLTLRRTTIDEAILKEKSDPSTPA
jgi:hypothetical protein